MTIINIILIATICVLIIDQTDVVDHIKAFISKVLTNGKIANSDYELKPFDCSLCMSTWSNLLYVIIVGKFTIPYITLILLTAIMTPVINDLITLLKDALESLMNKVHNILQ